MNTYPNFLAIIEDNTHSISMVPVEEASYQNDPCRNPIVITGKLTVKETQ